MGDAFEDWASYLRRMTSRSGWSVARLARDSGIHRATIFKWLNGSRGVTVANVRLIAEALGDDVANALRAAGNVESGAPEPVDPREDPVIQQILADPYWSEDERVMLVERELLRIKREREQRQADYEFFKQRRAAS